MPAERTLPIAAEHREFTVKVDGEVVPREHALQALSVTAAANRIASARLTYVDGAPGEGDFPLSNKPLFAPGATIEISAGAGSNSALVFKGIVTGIRLKVREASPSTLTVDCRHAASRLTLVRRSANFFDKTDSDAMASLLSAAGVNGDVHDTTVTHKQLVQHDCSDWDFINARAAANGLLVLTRAADLVIKKPELASAAAELRFGATLLDLDAEVDGRAQTEAIKVLTWAAADQAVTTTEGDAPAFKPPGNFDPDTLASGAGSDALLLRHAALDEAEATALANATWQTTRLDLASGRLKCVGIATLLPGDTVTLSGVGERFSGDVLISGVRHEFDTTGGWKTHLQFGGTAPDPALRERLQSHRTAALLAPVAGLQAGVVTSNEDPDGEFRVRVMLPLVVDGDDGIWARVAAVDAGSDRGFFFRPEVGDEVLVGFLDDDPRQPVILGMLHSSAMAAPLEPSNDNSQKGYKSRSGIQLMFDDDKKIVTLLTPGGNSLVLDDDAQGITIKDQHGNKIVLGSDGLVIESSKALSLKAGTEGKFESSTSMDVTAGTALTCEGTASNDIKSGGVVKVAGSAIQLG
jgi:Rhs element Vgr protein